MSRHGDVPPKLEGREQEESQENTTGQLKQRKKEKTRESELRMAICEMQEATTKVPVQIWDEWEPKWARLTINMLMRSRGHTPKHINIGGEDAMTRIAGFAITRGNTPTVAWRGTPLWVQLMHLYESDKSGESDDVDKEAMAALDMEAYMSGM